jgi:uncharacterized protein YwqG
MKIFDWLIGRTSKTSPARSDFETLLKAKASKAIHLAHGHSRQTRSKLGGMPDIDPSFEWPEWNGSPMSFLGQIDLSSLPRIPGMEAMPPVGMLYFFYDQEQGTWGFDPKDLGSWKVYYLENTDSLRPLDPPPGLPSESTFREVPLLPGIRDTYPSFERLEPNLSGDLDGAYEIEDRLRELSRPPGPEHQIGGFPNPIQGDSMEKEAQLVSNGLYCGDPSGYNDPRAQDLSSGSKEWLLLLQVDTDEKARMMWGDAGMLYFWIRRTDLERREFSKVWMILQCG